MNVNTYYITLNQVGESKNILIFFKKNNLTADFNSCRFCGQKEQFEMGFSNNKIESFILSHKKLMSCGYVKCHYADQLSH